MKANEPICVAALGVDHRHIVGMAQGMIDAGARFEAFWTEGEPQPLAGFTRHFPDVPRVHDRRAILDNPRIALVLLACPPDQRAAFAIEAMRHGKDVMVDKPGCITLDELAQVRACRLARRYDFLRILVAQLVEREAAAAGERQRLGEEGARVDRREARARAQVPLGVRGERVAALRDRRAQPDRGQRVLQRAARPHVHVHVARGDEWQSALAADRLEGGEPRGVARAREQFDRQPAAAGERFGDPARLGKQGQARLSPRRAQREAVLMEGRV